MKSGTHDNSVGASPLTVCVRFFSATLGVYPPVSQVKRQPQKWDSPPNNKLYSPGSLPIFLQMPLTNKQKNSSS